MLIGYSIYTAGVNYSYTHAMLNDILVQYPPDDDKCETFTTQSDCEDHQRQLVARIHLCEWRRVDAVIGESVLGCEYLQTETSYKVIYLSLFYKHY